jgi:recombinational DNA repair protein (RecF pathway)
VPAISIQTEACVLLKRPPAEKYQMLTVFSAEHGLLTVLQRLAAKPNPDAPQLDLFDDAALTLAAIAGLCALALHPALYPNDATDTNLEGIS